MLIQYPLMMKLLLKVKFFYFFLINSNKGKFVISPEGILIKSKPFFSKNFKLSTSNAVDKKFIFFFYNT